MNAMTGPSDLAASMTSLAASLSKSVAMI